MIINEAETALSLSVSSSSLQSMSNHCRYHDNIDVVALQIDILVFELSD